MEGLANAEARLRAMHSQPSMRIGVNALYLIPGGVGGTETYLRGLLAALAEIDAANRYFVFTNRETGPRPGAPRPPTSKPCRSPCARSCGRRAFCGNRPSCRWRPRGCGWT